MTINALNLGTLFCWQRSLQVTPSPERFLLCQLFSQLHVGNWEHYDFQQFVISDFGSSVVPGESVSSDAALGYNNEAELSMSPWPTCEEDPELSTPTDVVTDSDARHWLQLSPTDASNLTGNYIFEKEAPLLPVGNPRVSQLQEFQRSFSTMMMGCYLQTNWCSSSNHLFIINHEFSEFFVEGILKTVARYGRKQAMLTTTVPHGRKW